MKFHNLLCDIKNSRNVAINNINNRIVIEMFSEIPDIFGDAEDVPKLKEHIYKDEDRTVSIRFRNGKFASFMDSPYSSSFSAFDEPPVIIDCNKIEDGYLDDIKFDTSNLNYLI